MATQIAAAATTKIPTARVGVTADTTGGIDRRPGAGIILSLFGFSGVRDLAALRAFRLRILYSRFLMSCSLVPLLPRYILLCIGSPRRAFIPPRRT